MKIEGGCHCGYITYEAEVDPDLEVTEVTDRVVKAGGPALLFEHPKARTTHC